LAAVALLVASATGCGARARFSVLRPAMLNARQFGGTMSVGPFEGDPMASAAIQQDLRQRIMTAEGNPVALIEGAGGLLIHGVVAVFSYSEQMQQSQGSCTRTVTDSQGNSRQVSYSCTNYTRIGTASVSIGFNITVPSTGQTIFANTYSDSSSARRTATDAQPVAINGGAMLENIRAGLTADFSRVILPWREIVRVTLGRCGDARAVCENGIAALRASDFAAAIASFQQAIQTLEGQPETNPVHLAEAHWNLGLAREYSGDFAGAVESIMRAAELDPSGDFNMELENVQRMAEDAQRLNEQGVTAN
jgi:Flp pilus assembly protein TadD